MARVAGIVGGEATRAGVELCRGGVGGGGGAGWGAEGGIEVGEGGVDACCESSVV